MAVTVQDPYKIHTGNGIATLFAFDFKVLLEDDLYVTVDGVEDTTYTVSGLGLEGGGDITFPTAPASGAVIVIERRVALARQTHYQYNGDFKAEVVNPDFDRLWMAHQQMQAQVDRAPLLPIESALRNLELPGPVPNGFIRWRDDISGLECVSSIPSEVAHGYPLSNYAAVRGLTTSLFSGHYLLVLGRSAPSDLGYGFFILDSGDTSTVDNDGTCLVDGSGRRWKRYCFGVYNAAWFGADPTGVLNSSAAIAAADLACYNDGIGALYFPPGKYRCTDRITKQLKVSWYGDLSPVEAQSPQYWSVALVCDGPTGGDFISVPGASSTDGNVEVHHLGFYTANASVDAINCITANPKCVDVHHCSILNFSVGVKTNGAICRVYSNHINSCNIMIDCAGGESSVYDNHGYPHTLGILVRGSATKVYGNKLYGDGASAPYGIQVWGFGNSITGNVCDAFTDVGIYAFSNNTAPYSSGNPACDQNVIANNSVSAIGSGGTYNAAIVVHAKNGDVSGNLVHGNTIYNKRGDRTMANGVLVVADAGRVNDKTYVVGNTIANTTSSPVSVTGAGTKSNYRIKNNSGYPTENSGLVSGYNGLIVSHGLGGTPTFVAVTPQSSNIYGVGADSYTATTFRLLLRDSTGTLVPSGSPVSCNWRAVID